ncbi:Mrp/NBP35 ATP-binding protein [Carpediemonas membranifera]|uniref:Mrp/NBP35 ATP-binding protein n=1 Tax=Carpediemonas membranifera TaxID=201153 RepID=A0A8J6AYP3_9EUKA|nr:Mrp/NBP35 ATP-binding protein [Carpediemonas membranifera]|eukprot:KAG9390484.1 Mrp/NBP35 ATP-binding protein [Carpediemonas membranifera]
MSENVNMSNRGLDHVKNIISIVSGKGGVGKSSITTNLAVSLAQRGLKVGIADVDINGPSVAAMMSIPSDQAAAGVEVEDGLLLSPFTSPHSGVAVASMGSFVQPGTPLMWRGPMLGSATKQLLTQVAWDDLDYLLLDSPPGTSDIMMVVNDSAQLNGGIVVTTPQRVAWDDASRSIEMLRQLKVPVLGVVDNMASFECPKCGHNEDIFGDSSLIEQAASEEDFDILAKIPLIRQIRDAGDAGKPVVLSDKRMQELFGELAERVIERTNLGLLGVLRD